eukprot:Gb_17663 [translate_table: standard]
MPAFDAKMGVWIWLLVLTMWVSTGHAQSVDSTLVVTVAVNGSAKIAETDDDFICATLDWWPPEKCDYGRCSWGQASLLNLVSILKPCPLGLHPLSLPSFPVNCEEKFLCLDDARPYCNFTDLDNPILANAVKAFSPLKIRMGGTLQDIVLYDVGHLPQPCTSFAKKKSALFGYTEGCLPMPRWDKLNEFFAKTGAVIAFGLNALYGRHHVSKGLWGGAWNSSNARDFIQYTIDHGYKIQAWELGNELSGNGVGARITAKQYAADIIKLSALLNDIYKGSQEKPLLIAPDGFFDATWFKKLLQETGPNVLNVVTHHIYNLGAGVDQKLIEKILDPYYLSKEAKTFSALQDIVQKNGPWSSAWVGESGGAYNSGHHLVTDAFVFSFWYLDQLGMASTFNTKTYCRQSLIGGNYGLLNTSTYVPNPDYYSALLWHRLMGRGVLSTSFMGAPYLRAYAHCAKKDLGGCYEKVEKLLDKAKGPKYSH